MLKVDVIGYSSEGQQKTRWSDNMCRDLQELMLREGDVIDWDLRRKRIHEEGNNNVK